MLWGRMATAADRYYFRNDARTPRGPMPQPYKLTKWNSTAFPTQREIVTRLIAEGADPALRADPPGYTRAMRRFSYGMTLWVISGALLLHIQNATGSAREFVVRSGDRIDLQPGVRIGLAVAGEGYALYAVMTPFCLPTVGMTAPPEEQSLPDQRSA